ncbi:hypothetical protein ACNKHL_02445 [Shigella flexneri]
MLARAAEGSLRDALDRPISGDCQR